MNLITDILMNADAERLARAEEGIESGAFTVTPIRNDRNEVSGFVTSGTEYSVKILPGAVFCSCKDAMYRGTICKHMVALALTLTYPAAVAPTPEPTTETLPPPNLTLGKVRRERAFAA